MSEGLGDYAEDFADLGTKFTTVDTGGVPFTLAGTPAISCYKSNGTTQSTAGITLSADFDSVTGLNHVKVDLSADAFYATGNDYQLVITTGTINSVSAVGYVVAEFSIENRFMRGTNSGATAANLATVDSNVDTILVDTADMQPRVVAIEIDTGTTLDGKIDTIDTNVDTILVDTADMQPRVVAIEVDTSTTLNDKIDVIDGNVDSILVDTNEIGTAGAGLTNIDLPDQTMDITGNLSGSVGSVTGEVSADMVKISGTAAAADKLEEGAVALQLGAAATGTLTTTVMTTNLTETTDDHFNGRIITWTSGVLAQQSTDITDYSGTNGTLTFTAITEAASNGDTFIIS